MKTLLLIWSLAIGHCLAGPPFFGQQGAVASQSEPDTGFNPSDYGLSVTMWGSIPKETGFAYNDAVGSAALQSDWGL